MAGRQRPHLPATRGDKSVGELVFDVSARTSTLVREEIELAKTEVSEKVSELVRGSVVGARRRRLPLLRPDPVMEGIAWLLNDLVFGNLWLGFFVEAALFILIGAIAVLVAYRSLKPGAPPTPDQAIEEAKLTPASATSSKRRAHRGESVGPESRATASRPAGLRLAPRRRSAATSRPSARSSATRSRRCAPRSTS